MVIRDWLKMWACLFRKPIFASVVPRLPFLLSLSLCNKRVNIDTLVFLTPFICVLVPVYIIFHESILKNVMGKDMS